MSLLPLCRQIEKMPLVPTILVVLYKTNCFRNWHRGAKLSILPEFQSLILRLWQLYPAHCVLAILPFRNIDAFCGHLPKDSLVLERLFEGLCLSPFLLEAVLFPEWTESSLKVICGKCISSNLVEFLHNPSIVVRLEYLQNTLESLVNN